MAVINVLPKQVAELIAAGEVIERPASVIKELVENAIDAHAEAVTVEIKNGGVTFMRVTDNGIGFEQDDVRNAFLRHATSKITVQGDLDKIDTLGFRGEALASICAVSKVELITRHKEAANGILYRLEGGEETAFCETGCPQGTTFVVRDLFYNVPARMKFLKKDSTESNTIASLMDRMALSHPEVSFTFIRDGRQMLKTSGKGDLASAVYQVFGKQFYETLIPVSYEYEGITVSGYVSKPVSANRATRSMQMFFVNGRYIRTKTGVAALEQAYKGFIMVGKYPACVLNLQMDCSSLDVNVHPAKLEIRFTNERPVYESVYHGVRTALSVYDTRSDSQMPAQDIPTNPKVIGKTADRGEQLGFSYRASSADEPQVFKPSVSDYEEPETNILSDSSSTARKYYQSGHVSIRPINLAEYHSQKTPPAQVKPMEETPHQQPEMPADVTSDISPAVSDVSDKLLTDREEMPADSVQPVVLAEKEPDVTQAFPALAMMGGKLELTENSGQEKPLQYIGEVFQTYIIVQYDNNRLMMIDKHAAHERLIYERLKQASHNTEPQLLLEPVTLTLDKSEYLAVVEHKELLAQAGFEVEDFGVGTVLLRGVPLMLEKLDITEAFLEIAGYLTKHKRVLLSDKMEWIYANTACRAAIKAGDRSRPEELIALVRELESNPSVKYCPHGRPIYFFLSRTDIEKSFKRI